MLPRDYYVNLWNESARKYNLFESKWRHYDRIASLIAESLIPGELGLDLACGTGVAMFKVLREQKAGSTVRSILGIDISLGMVREAQRNYRGKFAQYLCASVREILPAMASSSFDFAMCNAAFWQFSQKESVLRALQRVLKPSGQFAFTLPVLSKDKSDAKDMRAKLSELMDKHNVPRISQERQQQQDEVNYESLLRQNGFEVLKKVEEDFALPLEAALEWNEIPIFGSSGIGVTLPSGIDLALSIKLRNELTRWRYERYPEEAPKSRWLMILSRKIG